MKCHACGRELDKDAVYCKYCGTAVPSGKEQGSLEPKEQDSLEPKEQDSLEPKEQGSLQPTPAPKSHRWILSVVSGVLLLCLILFWMIPKANHNHASDTSQEQVAENTVEEPEAAVDEDTAEESEATTDEGIVAPPEGSIYVIPNEIHYELPGGSIIRMSKEDGEAVQLSYVWSELIDGNSGKGYFLTSFYVNDRAEPVFAIQEGGETPVDGIALPGESWLVPYYVTYDEDERIAFNTGEGEEMEEGDSAESDYNISESGWYNFVKNAGGLIFFGRDRNEVSLGEIMSRLKHQMIHRFSGYMEDPLVYYNNEYDFQITFPKSIANAFSQDVGWKDYTVETGDKTYQLFEVRIDNYSNGISVVLGSAEMYDFSFFKRYPAYEDENCFIIINIHKMDFFQNADESDKRKLELYKIISDEAIVTFPNGEEAILGDFAR